jgi:hypothetical protein
MVVPTNCRNKSIVLNCERFLASLLIEVVRSNADCAVTFLQDCSQKLSWSALGTEFPGGVGLRLPRDSSQKSHHTRVTNPPLSETKPYAMREVL